MSSAKDWEVLEAGPDAQERSERLVEGALLLGSERPRGSIIHHERFTLTVAAALMIIGVSVILIGWSGAADTVVIEEQVPYVISGGLLGLALTVVGALTLFSHWLVVGIREARAREADRVAGQAAMLQSQAAILEVLQDISVALQGAPAKRARRASSGG